MGQRQEMGGESAHRTEARRFTWIVLSRVVWKGAH